MKHIYTHVILLILALCLAFGTQQTQAQNYQQIKADKATYLCGEGYGETLDEADDHALADLVSQISIEVVSSFSILEDEKSKNGGMDASSYISSKINTYSRSTLHNTERFVIEQEPDAHVMRYIKRSEINRIFEGRKRKVQEHLGLADNAQQKLKIGDALHHYYLAFTLLKTLQYPNEVTYTDSKNVEHLVSVWLPEQLKNIIDDVHVEQRNHDGNNIDLWFTYEGQPIVDLEYTYFDGRDWSNLNSAKDGRGVVELVDGYSPDNLQVKVEYAYRSIVGNLDQEEAEVMKAVHSNTLRNAYKNISLAAEAKPVVEPKPVIKPKPQSLQGQENTTQTTNTIAEMANDGIYRKAVDEVIAAVRSGNYHAASHCFTAEGLGMYDSLVSYGRARIVGQPNYKIYDKGDAVVARSVPMSFSFKKGVKKSFVEDVVFTFDKKSHKIDCLAFALDETAAHDILTQGYWPESARMTILEFMENYKTAYCLKRLKYLESIFDDNAYIIVGHVVNQLKRSENKDAYSYADHRLVKRTQYSKKQYIEKLDKCFKSNECVNIHFSNNDVVKSGKGGELYGIQIKQDYYSTNYGDTGYLLLLVDLNDPDRPIIKVRTWQEEPDPKEGLITIFDFN